MLLFVLRFSKGQQKALTGISGVLALDRPQLSRPAC
jgi:hypothetical protein